MYDEFTDRNTVVIAVAQEDKDLETHAKFLTNFPSTPPFDITADLGRTKTGDYGRASTYLIDTEGVVRQVFPSMIRYRASWSAVLNEIDRLQLAGE